MVGKDKIEITAELKDLLTGQLKKIQAEAEKLDKALNQVGSDSPIAKKKGGFWSKFSNTDMNLMSGVTMGTLAAKGITAAASAMVGFGKSTVDSLVNYQYFHASLKTMMHGDVEMAKALENQLVNLAKTTPFSLVDVQEGTKQLMAYGFQANSIVGNMKMLGDVSSGVSAPLGDIVYLYGTLRTQGRAYTKDIMQFAGRGIPIVAELAKQFKTTEANVMDLAKEGSISFKHIEKAFKSMTKEGGMFFNLMEDQSKTVGGQISAMGDSWEQLKVNIGKSQTGIISGTVNFFNGMISALSDWQADSNRMDESFAKYGAKNFTWMEALRYHFTGGGDKGVIMDQEKMFNQVYDPAMESNSKLDKLKALSGLNYQLAATQKSYGRGDIDKERADRETAVLKGMINDLKGGLKLLSQPLDKVKKGGIEKEASDLEGVSKANRPTQVNINIENLVREFSNTFNTAAEALKMTPEAVAKVLIGAVNDVSNLKYT